MGITVENFIKTFKINLKAKDKTFDDFVSKHVVTKYIDVATKAFWCEAIIKNTTHIKDGNMEIVKIDSVARHIVFVMRIIDLYTDICIDFKDGKYVSQYDQLNEVGAIDYIINNIPESEYIEFNAILDMKLNDFRDNEYSITALLYNLKESVLLSNGLIGKMLSDEQNVEEDE